MFRYAVRRVFPHRGSVINCLSFSPDGKLIAAGFDDGKMTVTDHFSGIELQTVHSDFPVTALRWHPGRSYAIYIGYANGGLLSHRFMLNHLDKPAGKKLDLGSQSAIEDLDVHTSSVSTLLAVATGSQVNVLKLVNNGVRDAIVFLVPPSDGSTDSRSEEHITASVAFYRNGGEVIGSYLNDGILCWDLSSKTLLWSIQAVTRIGRLTLSPSDKSLVVHNLQGGFDLYDLDTRTIKNTFPIPTDPKNNIILPALFIHDGVDILLGTTSGTARICDTSADIVQVLHDDAGGVIPAIAYTLINARDKQLHYIATGSSKGEDSRLIIWEAQAVLAHEIDASTIDYRLCLHILACLFIAYLIITNWSIGLADVSSAFWVMTNIVGEMQWSIRSGSQATLYKWRKEFLSYIGRILVAIEAILAEGMA